jgi:hypothetical protein
MYKVSFSPTSSSKKKNRVDQSNQTIIHIYMEVPEGNSHVVSQTRKKCHFFFFFFLRQNRRTGGGLVPALRSWYLWEGGGKGKD